MLITKICDNLWHLWENLFSIFIRDIVGIRARYMVRRSLPQITRIYTDVGAKGKNTDCCTNHTDVACWYQKSVIICGICGRTSSQSSSVISLASVFDNPMVRRSLPQIARIYTDVGAKGKKIAHLTVPFLILRRFCRHNICIPNAQYYEFSALQNLWCEILEFWALGDNVFIHSELCGFRTKRYEIRLANELLLYAIAPLLHSNSATIIMQ